MMNETIRARSLARTALVRFALACLLAGSMVACRLPQKMGQQPQYDPYEASSFWADGNSARPLVQGTVARGTLHDDPFLYTGKVNGQLVDSFPFPIDDAVMARGQQRFNIYCSPCHSMMGDGNGMIVQRGYRRPPSYHTEKLRTMPVGHFFDVITNGFGAMPAYGPMIPVRDRWAIVAYVRALQFSQNATLADLTPAERERLLAGGTH
ncbi:MAG: cytochrome c [Thermoanaerobaculia bacterium]